VAEENVELVRRTGEAWQRDDFEAWLSTSDPEVEWFTGVERALGRAGSVYRGHEGMREFWNLWRTDVDDHRIEMEELRDLGDERVLFLGRLRFRGPASGITVESQLANVMTLREGQIIHSEDYLSHADALKAVALEE
jgi:ketosteroid isomerase-like protein